MSQQSIVVDNPLQDPNESQTNIQVADNQGQGDPSQTQDNQLPEKYRGKTLEEVVQMHQESERRLGQIKNENGTWRNLADELITQKRAEDLQSVNQPVELPEVTGDSLLQDPSGSIASIVRHVLGEELAPIKDSLTLTQVNSEQGQFVSDHPDYVQIAESQDFQDWVGKSQIRVADAQAAYAGDLVSARRLLENYKELVAIQNPVQDDNQETQQVEQQSGEQVVTLPVTQTPTGVEGARQVATEVSGNGGQVQGKRIYTAAELLDMIQNNKAAYKDPAMQAELAEAFAEGRVKGL